MRIIALVDDLCPKGGFRGNREGVPGVEWLSCGMRAEL